MVLRDKLPVKFQKIKYGNFSLKDFDYPIHLYLKDNDIIVREKGSEIVRFLKRKHILITGATGFLGKMFVEKLLRSCDDIFLYIIIREKKGKLIGERINEMFNSYVFYRLRKIRPDFQKSVIALSGDMSKPKLGLSQESWELLANKVNIIYHVAATVRFDEPLRNAVQINILGTKEVIKLAKECQNLEVLTHVSTAFSNAHLQKIEEKFYDPVVSADKLICLTDMFPDEILDKISFGLLGGLPNTYTLTKQSSEDLIKNFAVGIPICICRPSIVMSSDKEPCKGWGDNVFGPIGFLICSALGLVHVQEGDHSGKADMVPADYVVNHCIAASYRTAATMDVANIPIYNCTAGNMAHSWKSWERQLQSHAPSFGSTKSITPYFIIFTKNQILLKFLKILFHRIPACVLDLIAVCTGKQPQLTKAYEKLEKFGGVLSFFMSNEFDFKNSNTEKLWDSLNEVDKKNFNFDMRQLNYTEYFTVLLLSMKEFIVGEFLDNLDESRAHFRRLKYGFPVAAIVFISFIIYIFYTLFNLFF